MSKKRQTRFKKCTGPVPTSLRSVRGRKVCTAFCFGVRKKNGDLSYSYNRMCVVSVPIKLRKIDIDYCQWRVDFHARCGQWFVLWIIFLVCKNVRFRNGYTLPRTKYYILLLNYYVCNIVMILCERKFLGFFVLYLSSINQLEIDRTSFF